MIDVITHRDNKKGLYIITFQISDWEFGVLPTHIAKRFQSRMDALIKECKSLSPDASVELTEARDEVDEWI